MPLRLFHAMLIDVACCFDTLSRLALRHLLLPLLTPLIAFVAVTLNVAAA